MSDPLPTSNVLLAQFENHLKAERYSAAAVRSYLSITERFLGDLIKQRISIDDVVPAHVSMFIRCERRRFKRRYGCAPQSPDGWCGARTAPIHHLLRWVKGQWPPLPPAASLCEADHRVLCVQYAQRLREHRGLAADTIDGLVGEARRFLGWWRERHGTEALSSMAVPDIDAYLAARSQTLCRRSRQGVSQQLRCFLRFLHAEGRTTRDFAPSVLAPSLYACEAIPSTLRPDEASAVLAAARADRSASGRRNYAMLMLLSTYGLRAGEVTRLCLDDIDWHADRLLIRHTKTGAQTTLPLLPRVGEALLDYLHSERPTTNAREIFIRAQAPYRAFRSGSSLYSMVRKRLHAAGVAPSGKRGPHAFRHALAVDLLRAAVSLKTIGDLLGHQSAASTAPYLKLATEELRDVALAIPPEEGRS